MKEQGSSLEVLDAFARYDHFASNVVACDCQVLLHLDTEALNLPVNGVNGQARFSTSISPVPGSVNSERPTRSLAPFSSSQAARFWSLGMSYYRSGWPD